MLNKMEWLWMECVWVPDEAEQQVLEIVEPKVQPLIFNYEV